MDQLRWFLCGLGPAFESFSASTHSVRPFPNFVDLSASVKSHELFMKNLHGTPTAPTVAFLAEGPHVRVPSGGPSYWPNRAQAHYWPNQSSFNIYRGPGRNMGHNNRNPTCQLCRITGHYIYHSAFNSPHLLHRLL
ncbi:hypothetical protein HanPI659440_Chr13g0515611 [Helianthus annuus]|nr:hypothetical protein HanPI659440_Chr13g0515611 [Helianthus annuus]